MSALDELINMFATESANDLKRAAMVDGMAKRRELLKRARVERSAQQAVIDAAREILVWHDENLTDGVNRECVIRDLRVKLIALDGDK